MSEIDAGFTYNYKDCKVTGIGTARPLKLG